MFIKTRFVITIISDLLTLMIIPIRTFECKLWEPLFYRLQYHGRCSLVVKYLYLDNLPLIGARNHSISDKSTLLLHLFQFTSSQKWIQLEIQRQFWSLIGWGSDFSLLHPWNTWRPFDFWESPSLFLCNVHFDGRFKMVLHADTQIMVEQVFFCWARTVAASLVDRSSLPRTARPSPDRTTDSPHRHESRGWSSSLLLCFHLKRLLWSRSQHWLQTWLREMEAAIVNSLKKQNEVR